MIAQAQQVQSILTIDKHYRERNAMNSTPRVGLKSDLPVLSDSRLCSCLHSLEGGRKYFAIWYRIFRQSP